MCRTASFLNRYEMRRRYCSLLLIIVLFLVNTHVDGFRRVKIYHSAFVTRSFDAKVNKLYAISPAEFLSISRRLENKLLPAATNPLTSQNDVKLNLLNDAKNSVDNIIAYNLESQLKSLISNTEKLFQSILTFDLPSYTISNDMNQVLTDVQEDLTKLISYLSEHRSIYNIDYSITEGIEIFITGLLLSAITSSVKDSYADGQPYGPMERYDPIKAEQYFSNRPIVVLLRTLDIMIKSSSFLAKILANSIQGKLTDLTEEQNRADELAQLLNDLGPAFIKIGQSLSIRTDLLRPAYLKSLSQLQDRVPSFPTSIAISIIENEFKRPVSSLFASGLEENAQVVAAASLGQVYKATLRSDGSQVAVKVQRPNIIQNIALDMYILRQLAPILKGIFQWDSDVLGIVDDWGVGFVNELDYFSEATNAQVFMNSIVKTPLKDVVFAPEVISNCSSKRVLTSKWIDGERIEKSSKEEVTALCNIAMNTYLSMLLETPILHCDPHPGNLKRTPDGRLCIMDWGLCQSIDPVIQTTLIAHISHLVGKDYAKVPSDLVKLGFVPSGKEQVILEQGVVEVLADIYGRWAMGGGAGRVDINIVLTQVSGLTAKYGNLFQLPPYFAYIARAFSVLEGIGLSSDPQYSIVNECLPYISKRLLTDPNAKTADALESFIFGARKETDERLIDADRLKLLVKGMGRYSDAVEGLSDKSVPLTSLASVQSRSASANISMIQNGLSDPYDDEFVDQIDYITDQIFDILFPNTTLSNGQNSMTPIQKIMIEEVGKVIGAGSRLLWSSVRDRSGKLPSGRSLLGTLIDPIGIFSGSHLVEVDDYDKKVLNTTSTLVQTLQEYLPLTWQETLQNLSPAQTQSIISLLIVKIWDRRNQIRSSSFYLFSQLLRQTAERVEKKSFINVNRKKKAVSTSLLSDRTQGSGPSMSSPIESEKTILNESPRAQRARELLAATRRNAL